MAAKEQWIHTRERLLKEISRLSDNELNWKPSDSTWSIAQVVEHIAKAEDSIARVIQTGFTQPATHDPQDLPLHEKIPDRTTKIQAPERLEPSQEPHSHAQLVALLAQSHARALAILDQVTETTDLAKTSPPHPHVVFGRLSTEQWIDTLPLHELRHIGQIEELKAQLPRVVREADVIDHLTPPNQ